jgi:hypothetical protein
VPSVSWFPRESLSDFVGFLVRAATFSAVAHIAIQYEIIPSVRMPFRALCFSAMYVRSRVW